MHASRKKTGWFAGSVAVAIVFLLAGCSAGGGSETSSASAPQDAGGSAPDFAARHSATALSARAPRVATAASVETRAVISTGRVSVVSSHLEHARARVDELMKAFGGYVSDEQTSHDRSGRISYSTLTLRVPVTSFTAAMHSLAGLGTVHDAQSSTKDVTTQVIDVNSRVQTAKASLKRLRGFLRTAANVRTLIDVENEITTRESDLQSLKAQQAYLSDQTSLATITLELSRPDKVHITPGPLEHAGFLTGLRGGWHALQSTVVVALTVVGATLPFLVLLGLLALPLWFIVRRLARQHAPAPDVAPSE